MNQILKCTKTGTMVEVISRNYEDISCGEKKMVVLKENTEDASTEKHVPLVNIDGNKVIITVGSIEHPMEEKHFIEWIEVLCENEVYRKYLHPGEKPHAEFIINSKVKSVREFCNLHGLWTYEIK